MRSRLEIIKGLNELAEADEQHRELLKEAVDALGGNPTDAMMLHLRKIQPTRVKDVRSCPTCGRKFERHNIRKAGSQSYCEECGQRLVW